MRRSCRGSDAFARTTDAIAALARGDAAAYREALGAIVQTSSRARTTSPAWPFADTAAMLERSPRRAASPRAPRARSAPLA